MRQVARAATIGLIALVVAGVVPLPAAAALPRGRALAWGENFYGQLGDGTNARRLAPVGARTQGGAQLAGVATLAGGNGHTLAVMRDGRAFAWGWNAFGQLGEGTNRSRLRPVAVKAVGGATDMRNATAGAAGAGHSLWLLRDGTVAAAGSNSAGELGDGSNIARSTPVYVRAVGGGPKLRNVIAVAAMDQWSMALLEDGRIVTWGANSFGQLGDNSSENGRSLPGFVKSVAGAGHLRGVSAVAACGHAGEALTDGGRVLTWGNNGSGQLGDGTTTNRGLPGFVEGAGGRGRLQGVRAVGCGALHMTAILAGGGLVAWGANEWGQLGDGTGIERHTPVIVRSPEGPGRLRGIVATAGGFYHTVALTIDGQVLAWGRNNEGQLGNGTLNESYRPGPVLGPGGAGLLLGVARVAAGALFSLAVTR